MNTSSIKSFIKNNSWVALPAIISFISTLILLTNIVRPFSQASVLDAEQTYSRTTSNQQVEIVQEISNRSMDVLAANTGGCGCPSCCTAN
jgi:hypothetical protein